VQLTLHKYHLGHAAEITESQMFKYTLMHPLMHAYETLINLGGRSYTNPIIALRTWQPTKLQ
jgi:hypothetical protein